MADGMLSLSWNNHSTTFSHTLAALRAKERYTDVTLACEGKFYQVHKLVLSTCSEYFENMFDHTPCKHPVIVLSEIHREELEALLSYMYAGYVNVAENSLARLIKVAELLEVKGLAVPDEPPSSGKRGSNGHRTNESRVSPLARNVQSHSSTSDDRNMLATRSQSPSDDRTSPHPKRQRTRSEVSLLENTHSPKRSPLKEASRHTDYDHKEEAEPSWDEDDGGGQRISRAAEDQVAYQHQESLTDKVQVTLDENLVKEELVEDLRDGHSHSPKYENMADNTSDGGQSSVKLMIPKYEQSSEQEPIVQLGLGQQPPLHEAVIEALAGPSGMQGWAGGSEASRRLEAGGDLSSLPLCQTGTQSIPPLVGVSTEDLCSRGSSDVGMDCTTKKKMKHCPYCPYSTTKLSHMISHNVTHISKKFFSCPVCSFQTSTAENLRMHIRNHARGLPHMCNKCPLMFFTKGSLITHLQLHDVPSHCGGV
uniref:BTB domain-containing protein n=1 Tax=Scylla olivacea TaxID=85551 RepID=A0A0P4WGT1_SCYOL